MKLLKVLASLLLFTACCFADTTVSLNVTDIDSLPWKSATYQVKFVTAASTTGAIVKTGTLDASGNASMVLTINSSVPGSHYQFKVCPLAQGNCFFSDAVIAGSTQTVNIVPPAIRIDGSKITPSTLAYADIEIINPFLGAQYYNVSVLSTHQWNGSTWSNIGGSGGSSGSGAGLGLNSVLSYDGGITINDGSVHTVGTAPGGSIFNGKTTLAQIAAISINGATPFSWITSAPFTGSGAYNLVDADTANLDLGWLCTQAALMTGKTYIPGGTYIIGSARNLPLYNPMGTFASGAFVGNATAITGDGPAVTTIKAGRDFGAGVPLFACGDPAGTVGNSLGRYSGNNAQCVGNMTGVSFRSSAASIYPTVGATPIAMTGIAWGARLAVTDVWSQGFGQDWSLVGDHTQFLRAHADGGTIGFRWAAPSTALRGDLTFVDFNASGQSQASISIDSGASLAGVVMNGETYMSAPVDILAEAGACTDATHNLFINNLFTEFTGNAVYSDETGLSAGTWTDANKCRAVIGLHIAAWTNIWSNTKLWTTGGRGRRATIDAAQINILIDSISGADAQMAPISASSGPSPIATFNVKKASVDGYVGSAISGNINGWMTQNAAALNLPLIVSAFGNSPLLRNTGQTTNQTNTFYSSNYTGLPETRINNCLTDAVAVKGICDASVENGPFNTNTQIICGNSAGDSVVLYIPIFGAWYGNMSDGTSSTLKQWGGCAIRNHSPLGGSGTGFRIGATNASHLAHLYYATSNGGGGTAYLYAEGFEVFNHLTQGAATATGQSAYIEGTFFDNSTWYHMSFTSDLDVSPLYTYKLCCQTVFELVAVNGNGGTGVLPLTVHSDGSGGASSVTFSHSTFTHNGTGQPIIKCDDTTNHVGSININDSYFETNSADTNSPSIEDSGCGTININNMDVKCEVGSYGGAGVQIDNLGTPQVNINGMHYSNGSGSCVLAHHAVINNVSGITSQTDTNGHLSHYTNVTQQYDTGTALAYNINGSGNMAQFGGTSALDYVNFAGSRAFFGKDLTNGAFVQGSTGTGVAFLANNSTPGAGLVGKFDQNGNFSVGNNATAFLNPFYVSANGIIQDANGLAITGADVTCGTGGTIAACTTFNTITGLTITFPLVAQTWSFTCDLVVGQATAAAADQIGIQTATNGSTNLEASAIAYTASGTSIVGAITGVAATTTAQSLITFTPGATGTKMPIHIQGTVEGTSATGTVLNIVVLTGSNADLLTIYRGSSCQVK